MHRGFRFRLYPTPEQAETLGQWVGVVRLVYNLALEQRRDFWRQYRSNEGRSISYASQCRELTELRGEFEWIRDVPRDGVEAALKDLDRAFQAFFKGGGYPHPRRLGLNDSVRLRGRETRVRALNAKWGEVRLPKIGPVRFRMSRSLRGEALTTTVVRCGGAWFVTFVCDVGAASAPNSLPAVGIDRGVATILTLSDGSSIHLPSFAALESVDGRRNASCRAASEDREGMRVSEKRSKA